MQPHTGEFGIRVFPLYQSPIWRLMRPDLSSHNFSIKSKIVYDDRRWRISYAFSVFASWCIYFPLISGGAVTYWPARTTSAWLKNELNAGGVSVFLFSMRLACGAFSILPADNSAVMRRDAGLKFMSLQNKNNVADCDKLLIKMFSSTNDAHSARIYSSAEAAHTAWKNTCRWKFGANVRRRS